MEAESNPMDAQELLADMEWLSRLAHRLVRDPALADDAVQDAWLAASRRVSARGDAGAPDRGLLGATLRGIVQHALRGARRRRFHEASAARSEALPSTEELLEIGERQQELWRHLAALDEPYRRALMLRFQKSLGTKELSTRLGEKEDTVRWRIRRGLELLKDSIERDETGPGLLGLVPVAALSLPSLKAGASSGVASASGGAAGTSMLARTGGLWMTNKMLIGAAGVLLATLAAMWAAHLTPDLGEAPPVGRPRASEEPTNLGLLKPSDGLAVDTGRLDASPNAWGHGGPPTGPSIVPDLAKPFEAMVVGRLVDSKGRPVDGAEILASFAPEWERRATTAADGSFALSCPPEPDRRVTLQALPHRFTSGTHVLLGRDPQCHFPPLDIAEVDVGDLVTEQAGVIVGTVQDAFGQPVVGAFVSANPWYRSVRTDTAGAFRLGGLELGDNFLRVRSTEHASKGIAVTLEEGILLDQGIVTLGALDSLRVRGQAVATNGARLPGAAVYSGGQRVKCRLDGTFDAQFLGESKVYLNASADGYRESRTQLCLDGSNVTFVLEPLGPRCKFQLVDEANGAPIGGGEIVLRLHADHPVASATTGFRRHAIAPETSDSRSGADGRLDARARASVDFLEVLAPGFQRRTVEVEADTEQGAIQVIALRRIVPTVVMGTLPKSLRGDGFESVEIQVLHRGTEMGEELALVLKTRRFVHTDRDGRFSLPIQGEDFEQREALVRAVTRIDGERIAISRLVRPSTGDTVDVGSFSVTRLGGINGHVLLPHPSLADEMRLQLDGADQKGFGLDASGRFHVSGLIPGRYLLLPLQLPSGVPAERIRTVLEVVAGENAALEIDPDMGVYGEIDVTLLLNGSPPQSGFHVAFERGGEEYHGTFEPGQGAARPVCAPAADGYRVVVEPLDSTWDNAAFELGGTYDIQAGLNQLDFDVETCAVICRIGPRHLEGLIDTWQQLVLDGANGRTDVQLEAAHHVAFPTHPDEDHPSVEVRFQHVPLYARNLRFRAVGREEGAGFEVPIDVTLEAGGEVRVAID